MFSCVFWNCETITIGCPDISPGRPHRVAPKRGIRWAGVHLLPWKIKRQGLQGRRVHARRCPRAWNKAMSELLPGDSEQNPQPPALPVKPHRGRFLLILGILAVLTSPICIGFIVGIITWAVAGEDLRLMNWGRMNPAGRKMTRAGRILAIVGMSVTVLLVVGLLWTAYRNAREAARRAECYSNMEQIAVSLTQYANDNDDRFPQANRWTDAVYPYFKTWKLLHCPADHSHAKSSYAMNAALSGKKLSEVRDPQNTVLIFDTSRPGDSPRGGRELVPHPGRHRGGNNFGFVSGYVKWYEYDKTPTFGPVPPASR